MSTEPLAWTFAALCFALWVIEHFGGFDARARLRDQRDKATERADDLALRLMVAEHERDVARSLVHPSRRHLRSVD